MARGIDPAKTYNGAPCRNCAATLRWRCSSSCVACKRARDQGRSAYWREYRAREREDSVTYFTHLLRHRREAALKRMAARNSEREMV